jgi:hypothetical protein
MDYRSPDCAACFDKLDFTASSSLRFDDFRACRDPEQTWGRLSHSTLERTRILAKSRKPLTKETCQLTVEDSAANLKQLVSSLRGPAHGLLLAHSLID